MSQAIRVGIMGAGWPGSAHAGGYASAGGFKVVAVADLIPARRKALVEKFKIEQEYADAKELIARKDIDAISVCVPNHLHAPLAVAAIPYPLDRANEALADLRAGGLQGEAVVP